MPQPPARKTGKTVAVVGSGPGRPRRGAAAGARRPRGHGVREERRDRRPAALRHPRLQDGEVAHRPPRRADGGRRRRRSAPACRSASCAEGEVVTDWSKETRQRRRADAPSSTPSLLAGGAEQLARPAGAGPRPRRRPLRDGVPAAAEQGQRRRQGRGPDPRRRQGRDRHRRRRHRQRLRRHQQPPRREERDPVRADADAARAGEQAAGLAVLADQAAHLVEPRGRLRARVRDRDQGVHRRGRQAHRR